jgi:predicted DCC family thiol-disulfide oxidoreductase YuxK
MATASAQPSSEVQGAHLVLYDGVCGLCNYAVQFLLKHDRRAAFSFAPLQSPTGKAMLAQWAGESEDLTSFYVVADFRRPHARAVKKSDAALFVARQLNWPWKAACGARLLPKAVRDFLYDRIARSRYRIFGRHEQCLIPSDETRTRFVDY